MDPQQFLAAFGHIARAAGGIARLRELVLQLAVQGKLVVASVTDESSTALLNRVRKVRSQLVADKKLPREKPYPSISEAERSTDVPQHWQWAYFGEVWHLLSGRDLAPHQYNDSGAGVPYITGASNIENGLIAVNRWTPEPGVISTTGDLLITCKGTIGKTAFNNIGDAHIARQIMAIRDFSGELEPRFLKIWLDGFVGELVKKSKSMIPGFSREDLIFAAYPIFPREEQLRIVAKVDDLMALCDQLDQQQQDRRKLQNALRQSTLQALAGAQSPHELQASWQRLQANFGQLFSEPADVDDVIAELKNLAVRGVLVEASSFAADLARITADCSALRSEYIATGLMRRQKLVGMAENDIAYPDHWPIAAFDEVAVVIGGVTKGRDLRGKKVVVCPYLAVANVQRGYFKLEGLKSIEIAEDELPKYLVHVGDLLITEGGDWDKVGRTATWQGGVENCLHQNHVFKARIPSEKLLKAWVELVLNSGVGRDYFAGASKQTTNLASINMTQLRSFPLPIPPVEEQRRILKALAALTDLCEEWRGQLKHKRDLASLLATASVASLTGISIDQDEDTTVKAPQTELIALLRLAAPPDVKAQAPLATFLTRHQGEMAARDLWQRFGGEIDAFYAQLKIEVAHGWIADPEVAQVREKAATEAAKA